MAIVSRVLGGVAAAAILAALFLWMKVGEYQEGRAIAAMTAEDALVQGTDLARIARFRYRDDRTLDVTDDTGREFELRFVAACPGLKGATDFSMVTESYRDLDRFTGIVIDGQLCRFKDFAPHIPAG